MFHKAENRFRSERGEGKKRREERKKKEGGREKKTSNDGVVSTFTDRGEIFLASKSGFRGERRLGGIFIFRRGL